MKTTGISEMKHKANDIDNVFDDMFLHNVDDGTYMSRLLARQYQPRFEIVSFEQFKNAWLDAFDDWDKNDENDMNDIKYIYNCLTVPQRSTKHSAGYDFKSPINFKLKPGESIMIPTGIRSYMPHNMVLMIFPRSGLGTKYQFHPANLTCVIDSDYFYANNEGHILIRMVNSGNKTLSIRQGQAFVQGIFSEYFTTYDDNANGVRTGGMGSTDKEQVYMKIYTVMVTEPMSRYDKYTIQQTEPLLYCLSYDIALKFIKDI